MALVQFCQLGVCVLVNFSLRVVETGLQMPDLLGATDLRQHIDGGTSFFDISSL